MNFFTKNGKGLLLCLAIAIPSWFAGKAFPIVGGAVIAILAGMVSHFSSKKKAVSSRVLNSHQKKYCNGQSFFWASV